MKKKIGFSKSTKKYAIGGQINTGSDDPFNTKAKRKLDRVQGRYSKTVDKIDAAEDAGVSPKARLVDKKKRLQNKMADMTSTMRWAPLTGYYKKGGSVKSKKK